MKRRKSLLFVILTTLVLTFTGCADSFPELTEAEGEAVGEYAARLLLKYDANNRSRLVDFSEVEARDRKLAEKRRKELEKLEAAQSQEEKEESGMDPVEDTPIVDNSQSVGPTIPVAGSLEEFFGLPEGVLLVYNGCEVQQSIESDIFTLDATAGKKLLLLKFGVHNQSGADVVVDMLSQNAQIRVSVNDTYTVSPLRTMLLEDLATYKDTVSAGGSMDTLLVVEINEETANAITAISLSLKNDLKTYTISLQ